MSGVPVHPLVMSPGIPPCFRLIARQVAGARTMRQREGGGGPRRDPESVAYLAIDRRRWERSSSPPPSSPARPTHAPGASTASPSSRAAAPTASATPSASDAAAGPPTPTEPGEKPPDRFHPCREQRPGDSRHPVNFEEAAILLERKMRWRRLGAMGKALTRRRAVTDDGFALVMGCVSARQRGPRSSRRRLTRTREAEP